MICLNRFLFCFDMFDMFDMFDIFDTFDIYDMFDASVYFEVDESVCFDSLLILFTFVECVFSSRRL